MNKNILFFVLAIMVSCHTEFKEEIIKKHPVPDSEKNIGYYLQKQSPIDLNISDKETIIAIKESENFLYFGIKKDKDYSIKKYDIEKKTLENIISGLEEIKDMAVSEKYIFVTQKNSVQAFNIKTNTLEVVVGNGTSDYKLGMHNAFSLLLTDKHLIVRDAKRFRYYKLENIIPENTKQIEVEISSDIYTSTQVSCAIANNKLYFVRSLNAQQTIQIYDLDSKKLMTTNAKATSIIGNKFGANFITAFHNALFVVLNDGSFAKVNAENMTLSSVFKTKKAKQLAFSKDNLYVLEDGNNRVVRYSVENITYRKY